MNESEKAYQAASGGVPTQFQGYTGDGFAPADLPRTRHLDPEFSENGFNFVGEDSLGRQIKGFVQTTELQLAQNELERAGIHIQSIVSRRGVRKKNRRPTSIEFATLAEQFGDLMEVGQSPTQICRLLSY